MAATTRGEYEMQDLSAFDRYVVLLEKPPGTVTTPETVRAHVQYLRRLETSGHMVFCGPFTDYDGGMVVLKAVSKDEALALVNEDPYIVSGARTFELRTWRLSCADNNHLGRG